MYHHFNTYLYPFCAQFLAGNREQNTQTEYTSEEVG